jgi:hypothetical protein
MEPDTYMRDNTISHIGVNYDEKLQLQVVPEGI